MYDESSSDDDASNEIYTINTQSLPSKQNNVPQKFVSAKRLKHNITTSIKRRASALNKIFVNDDSFIRINNHNHYLKSIKTKPNDIITINVSGNRYQTHLSTLENYPNTLLGNKHKRKYYWNNEHKEYFFNRHRACFEAILYYYQSNGRLRRPDYVPLDTFFEEVLFFDLGKEAISQIQKLENVSIIKYIDLPNWRWRRYIWFHLEYPQHSNFARIIQFISMFLIILSCITLAIATLPKYNNYYYNICEIEDKNFTLPTNGTSTCSSILSSPFFIIQAICVLYFTIEFLFRLISTPSYYRFILSIYNWIDLAAIVPFDVYLGLVLHTNQTDSNRGSFMILRMLQLLRFLRVFKLFSFFKRFKTLRVLNSAFKESFIDFIIMISILTMVAFLFGSAVYFAEEGSNGETFDSIPKSIYWGITTIATVGYGDMYPITAIGRVLACGCAFCGIAISGMLISVLIDHYQRVYNRRKFSPEQILSAIHSSDSEHDEKQDFINRNLSGSKKTLSGLSNLPPKSPLPLIFINNRRKSSKYNYPSSYVRFIFTLIDDQTNNKFMDKTANEIMKELTEIIRNTGDQIHLKLVSAGADSSNLSSLTTNELSSISEE